MLTRKKLSNPINISAKTLLHQWKDVEANATITYALCTSENSPYKDFNCQFSSGTNWETNLEWLRVEMYHILEADKVYKVNDDEDPDAIPTVSVDDNDDVKDDGGRKGKGAKGKDSDEEYDPNEDGDDDRADGSNKVVEAAVVAEESGNNVPYEWIFKGYIAFALWGYIPIPGGYKYKSLVMCSVDGDESNIESGSRKDLRKKKLNVHP